MSQNIIASGLNTSKTPANYDLNRNYENLGRINNFPVCEEAASAGIRCQGIFNHEIFSNRGLTQRESAYCLFNSKKEIKIADIRKSLTPDSARSLHGFTALLNLPMTDAKKAWLREGINNASLPSDYKTQLLRKLNESAPAA